MDASQVMGPNEGKEITKMAPKFLFDGGNWGKFQREFPFVAEYYGVAEAYYWEPDRELSEKEQRTNVLAVAVLRQYITDDVLQTIMTGEATWASVLYGSLQKVFFSKDARTRMQITTELMSCSMRIGEPLLGFLGRINGLVNELLGTGEKVDEKSRMVIIASKLRPALKEAAEDKMERSPELTYEGLVAYLIAKQKSEGNSGCGNWGKTRQREWGRKKQWLWTAERGT